jgi:hypothetical protein
MEQLSAVTNYYQPASISATASAINLYPPVNDSSIFRKPTKEPQYIYLEQYHDIQGDAFEDTQARTRPKQSLDERESLE